MNSVIKKTTALVLAWIVLICAPTVLAEMRNSEDEELLLTDLVGENSAVLSEDFYKKDSQEEIPGSQAELNEAEDDYLEKDGSVLITVSAAGDLFPGSCMTDADSSFQEELASYGYDMNFVMANTKEMFQEDDVSLLSFDGVLNVSDMVRMSQNSVAPVEFADVLRTNGIDAVALASENNNGPHFEETQAVFEQSGISVGTMDAPGVVNVKGVDVAVLAFDAVSFTEDGINSLVTQRIAESKEKYPIVIVYFHWGNDGWYKPNDVQIRLGHMAVDAGADLVVGSHSQRIQPVEKYNGAYICYSLGNFASFDNERPSDMTSLIVQAVFRVKDGVSENEDFRIVPMRISSKSERNDFIPTPLTKPASIDGMITTMRENSKGLSCALENYHTEWQSN